VTERIPQLRLVASLQCTKLGSHLNTLLDHYQQFQEVAEALRTWLRESEAAVGKLLSETVSSDPAVLQKQLASAKVRRPRVISWGSGGARVGVWLLLSAVSSSEETRAVRFFGWWSAKV